MKKDLIKSDKAVDKLDRIKKEKFVEFYRESRGHISNCCRAVGIARQTYYSWLEKKDWFFRAIYEAEMELNDDMREVLIQKAGEGDLGAIIFYLKKRHPDFKETGQPENIKRRMTVEEFFTDEDEK